MSLLEYLSSKYPDIHWTYEAVTKVYTGTRNGKYIAFIPSKSFPTKSERLRLYDLIEELREAE